MTDATDKGRVVFEMIARGLVGGVLVYAGFAKALGPAAEFAANIAAYQLLPARFITPLSVALPWVEIWVGLFLITGFHTRYAAWVATALFAMFLVALGSALGRHLDLNTCGCFGQDSFTPKQTILGDVVLFGLTVGLSFLRLDRPYLSLSDWINHY